MRITTDAVRKYTERAAKRAQELKDLDVDRIDLVDKPATGRSFLLFKSEAEVEKASEGADALGRAYADQEFVEQYASLGGISPIPSAGAGPTFTGAPDSGAKFPTAVGGRLPKPNTPYELPIEGMEPGAGPVRIGESWLMNPQASGIAEPLDFKKPEPATVVKGVFTDVVMAPIPGSNRFDQPQSDAAIAKSGGSIWGSLVHGG